MLSAIRGTTLLRLPTTRAALFANDAWQAVCITAARQTGSHRLLGSGFRWSPAGSFHPRHAGSLSVHESVPTTLLRHRIFYYFSYDAR
ncbi:MAG TPA: hypothetical protein DDZ37_04500 [Spirochaetaceae bacterium]|nr:hypothetical protein [Spirochaetaceae bacterium]